jgi:hypothetical protein
MASISLYHGSPADNIETLEPRKGYVPGNDDAPPPAVYATDIPALAAAHAWRWSSNDGVDLYLDEGRVVLIVPKRLEERLKNPVFIYEVPAAKFQVVACDDFGHNFRTTEPVKCLAKRRFENVADAISSLGGRVELIDDLASKPAGN